MSTSSERFASTSVSWRQVVYRSCPVCLTAHGARQTWVLHDGRVTLTPHGSGACSQCGTAMPMFTGPTMRSAASTIADVAGHLHPDHQQRAALELSFAPQAREALTGAALRGFEPGLAQVMEESTVLWDQRVGFAAAGILTSCGATLPADVTDALMKSAKDVLLPLVDKRTKT